VQFSAERGMPKGGEIYISQLREGKKKAGIQKKLAQ